MVGGASSVGAKTVNLFTVCGHIRKYSFTFGFVIAIGLLNHIISFLLTVSIGEYFSLFFKEDTIKGRMLHWLGVQFHSADMFFIFFFGLLLLKGVFMLIENYETKRQGELFVKNIREQVFTTQIHTSADVFPLRSYGKYLLRYSNDMKSVQHYLTRGYIEGLSSTLFLGLGFLLMGQIQSTLTLLLLGLLFLSLLMIIVMTRRQTASIENSRSTRSRLLSFVARQFARFQLLKQRFEETKVISVFRAKSTSLYFSSMKYHLTESIVIALVPVMIMGCVGVMLWRMAYLDESMLASDGFMLVLILLMMEGGIRRILRVPGYLNKGKISLRKIEKMSQGAGREWDR